MSGLSKKERLKVLEMVSEIASEAAKNPNVVGMIEFQEELVESLYHTMVGLVELDDDNDDEFAEFAEFAEFDDDEEEEEADEKGKQDKGGSARV